MVKIVIVKKTNNRNTDLDFAEGKQAGIAHSLRQSILFGLSHGEAKLETESVCKSHSEF